MAVRKILFSIIALALTAIVYPFNRVAISAPPDYAGAIIFVFIGSFVGYIVAVVLAYYLLKVGWKEYFATFNWFKKLLVILLIAAAVFAVSFFAPYYQNQRAERNRFDQDFVNTKYSLQTGFTLTDRKTISGFPFSSLSENNFVLEAEKLYVYNNEDFLIIPQVNSCPVEGWGGFSGAISKNIFINTSCWSNSHKIQVVDNSGQSVKVGFSDSSIEFYGVSSDERYLIFGASLVGIPLLKSKTTYDIYGVLDLKTAKVEVMDSSQFQSAISKYWAGISDDRQITQIYPKIEYGNRSEIFSTPNQSVQLNDGRYLYIDNPGKVYIYNDNTKIKTEITSKLVDYTPVPAYSNGYRLRIEGIMKLN